MSSVLETFEGKTVRTSPKCSHAAMAAATILLVALGGHVAVVPVFGQHLLTYLGIGDREFGLMFGVASAAALVPALFAGWLTDLWGAGSVLRWSLVGSAVSLGLLAVSGASWKLMAGALALNRLFSMPLDLAATRFWCNCTRTARAGSCR